MARRSESGGRERRYCASCGTAIDPEARICPECGRDPDGAAGGAERTARDDPGDGGGSGTDQETLLVAGSGICAMLGFGSFLLGLLFGPFFLLAMVFALAGTVLGALGYWKHDSTLAAALGAVNLLEFLAGIGLIALFVLVFGLFVFGAAAGGVLVPVSVPAVGGTVLPAPALVGTLPPVPDVAGTVPVPA